MSVRENSAEYDVESHFEKEEEQGGLNGLHRDLKNRHIAMISLGGVIGTGLFLGTATSLHNGGPAGLLLGYAVIASVVISITNTLGEMIAYLPLPGGHIKLGERFVGSAASFAMGYNYWYNWTILLPTELSAAAVLMNYWVSSEQVSNAVWITIFLVIAIGINLFGAKAYGEAEFWFASIKILLVIGLIILGVIIDAGGVPTDKGNVIGVKYWIDPGPWAQYMDIPGATGRFLGFFSVLLNATFAFIGTEIVGIAAGEASNPRRNIPKALKKVYVRLIVFYIVGTFIIGLLVPSNDPEIATSTGTAKSSPFVIAITRANIKVLPHIVNACLVSSAWSASSSDLYISSRALYGLALAGNAPKIFTRVNRWGLPYVAMLFCSAFALLAYMGVNSGSNTVFMWFADMTSICGLITWYFIAITYLRFYKGMMAQGIDRSTLPFKCWGQPYVAIYVLVVLTIVLLFGGFQVFLHNHWDTATFVTTYLPLPVAPLLYFGYKFVKKTKTIAPSEMDFYSGLAEIEKLAEQEARPTTLMGQFFDAL
ncbi:amino acid transporter [Hesseltinella vesiculosa]|uniref:Amino acid transporter n=1 Tax=Hesseltinella vesiculosa TaxID=101127 RepID=A0A1X2GN47_9FUNG|nr:amino acid transporter [Hesseltinella vesiculosa]